MLHIYDKEDGSVGIFPEYFVDLDVVRFEGVASSIPSHEFLPLTDLTHISSTFLIMSNIDSWNKWSKNQMLDWLGSYSKGIA